MRQTPKEKNNCGSIRKRYTNLKYHKKGISPFITHSVFIGFAAFLIIVIINVMNTATDEYKSYITDSELEQFCTMIRSSIERIYVQNDYPLQTNTTYGQMLIDLPERIGDANYRISFKGTDIFISSNNGKKNETCRTGFNLTYNGFTTGGFTKIKYTAYVNGTKLLELSRI